MVPRRTDHVVTLFHFGPNILGLGQRPSWHQPKKKGRPKRTAPFQKIRERSVLRVIFDDQIRLHHDGVGDIAQGRGAHEGGGQFVVVDFQIVRDIALGQGRWLP